MTLFLFKGIVAGMVISYCSWLSGKRPDLAGFLLALPIASLIALAFSYSEHKNAQATIVFAKSIFVAVPVSFLFFVPFLLAGKLHLSFWQSYSAGLGMLIIGFFIHKTILTLI
ncbi:MAG: hypothetical protein HOF21_06175 [Nitrospina sp.]|nr:hypothetical protein [Nitrospina sp.]MBT5632522.1 hypothetical protein [Nitrospina sp.]